MTEPETIEQSAHDRLAAACAAFDAQNKMLPQGVPPFQVPDGLDLAAGLDGLVRVLIDAGVLSEAEFVEAKTLRLAELMEQAVEQVRELKRQALGLQIAAGKGPPELRPFLDTLRG